MTWRLILAVVGLVSVTGCLKKGSGGPLIRDGSLFIKCGDPGAIAVQRPYGFGLICGANSGQRYRLAGGLEKLCSTVSAAWDPYSLTCTVSIPLASLQPKGIFCQTNAATSSKVILRLKDVTRYQAGADSVAVAGSVYLYAWSFDGADSCTRHEQGHEMEDGFTRALDSGGARASRAKQWLQTLHDETWDYVAGSGSQATTSPPCLAHPDDD